jgi:UPF0271 protein
MDLNADMAEGSGPEGWAADAALLDVVTSANIACGGHAGDAETMRHACAAALERGVRIGAHPGYCDRENFGRIELALPVGEIASQVEEQLSLLMQIAGEEGGSVTHVKPHGALYHRAASDPELAEALAERIVSVDPALALLAPADSKLLSAARRLELPTAAEGFADRAYGDDGLLVPRELPGSLLGPEQAIRQALSLAIGGTVTTADGSTIEIAADSVCVHGDSPGAVELARNLRSALAESGVEVKAFA